MELLSSTSLLAYTASFASTLICVGFCYFLTRKCKLRITELEHNLRESTEALLGMAEYQMKTHYELSGNIEDIEQRLLDLSVPSQNSGLPLEKRHQIVTLARMGVSLAEIARKLSVPKGEAELILSLRKYTEKASPRSSDPDGKSRSYAPA